MTVYELYRTRSKSQPLDSMFKRLQNLQGIDPGFYVLAVHSFIEGILRTLELINVPLNENFGSYLKAFRSKLIQDSGGGSVSGFDFIPLAIQQHQVTNDVRHWFVPVQAEEARIATQHLRRFCEHAGIPTEKGLDKVVEYLSAWEERKSFPKLCLELKQAREKLQIETSNSASMALRLHEYEETLRESVRLKKDIQQKDKAIEELKAIKDRKDAKVDELRAERSGLIDELKKAHLKSNSMDDARTYLDSLSRMTVLSRTRADYERTVIRLTPEQKKVLHRVSLNEDFLIKGSAGTGKTLVLLKAIEKAQTGQVGFDLPAIQGSFALLTHTSTLVKYNQYVASLLATIGTSGKVSTADAFLHMRLQEYDSSIRIDCHLQDELAIRFPVQGLTERELSAEIENFIWGNDISYDEYVLEGINRRGMKRPLMKSQRSAIWKSLQEMEAIMKTSCVYTRNYAALFLAKILSIKLSSGIQWTDFIFIDEAQDLPAAMLKALKACTTRCVILAGDVDQSIYQPGFSFKRAGFDISGRTSILRTNFRNTVQLHEVAERYRHCGLEIDDENLPEAYREGPDPELYEAADVDGMLELLGKRVSLFLDTLGYAPENICVIVPREEEMEIVRSFLSKDGLSLSDIRKKEFDFTEIGSVRLTTMHSAKGLDFPVVLLFLPEFHFDNIFLDPATSVRLARNLIYVAMTRAMDHLNVFLREGSSNPTLIDLISCFKSASAVSDSNP